MRRARSIPEILSAPEEVAEVMLKDMLLDVFPEEILACKNLQVLDLSQNQITRIPAEIGQLRQLKHINFSHNPLTELPESIGSLEQLQKLELRNGDLSGLPNSIGQLSRLNSLRLNRNHIVRLPGHLGNCSQLVELTLSENQLSELPQSISQLTALRSIDLSANNFSVFPRAIARLPLLSYVQFQDNPIEENHPVEQLSRWVSKFFEERAKAKISPARSQAWLDILLLNFKDCLEHAPEDIFSALDAPMHHVRGNGVVVLEQILTDPFRSELPKTIVFAGFIQDFNMGEVKEELEKIGIAVKGNLPRKDAILVIGERPGRHLKLALQRALPIAVPAQVLGFLDRNEGKFLGAAGKQDESMVENLMGMLRSESAENRDLGFTLMESGGVPPEMITDLVGRWLLSDDEKEKFRCERLLTNHGPKALLSQVRNALNKKEIQNLPWSDLLFRISGIQPLQRNELYKIALKLGRIRLKDVLGMRGMDLQPLIQDAVFKGRLNLGLVELDKLPPEVLRIPGLTHLYLGGNELAHLPSNFDNLDQLVHLELQANHLIKLPSALGLLSRLEFLNLSQNRLHSLPSTVYGLKSLRHLDLSQNPIEGLPQQMAQLPSLEMLNLEECRMRALPDSILAIRSLATLRLSHNHLSNLEDALPQWPILSALQLCHNQLRQFPNWLGQIPNLRTLLLHKNPAKELPLSLQNSTHLEKLAVDSDLDWEQAIPVLKGISTLETLNVVGKLPHDGFESLLRKELPNCRIHCQ